MGFLRELKYNFPTNYHSVHFAGNAGSSQNKDGNETIDPENRRFTATEITSMTNDYERVIGRGGFGTVYHGCMNDGTQVAVKLLSQDVANPSEFLTEVIKSLLN